MIKKVENLCNADAIVRIVQGDADINSVNFRELADGQLPFG